MAITVAGEGWIGDLLDWFPAPEWMQVYDRRSTPQIPVGLPPGGGTQPIRPDLPPAGVPAVVPQPTITSTNTQPPPLIPIGVYELPTSGALPSRSDPEETMALEDWVDTVRAVATAWGGQTSDNFRWGGPAPYGAPASTPTILQPAPGQMGDNGHWVPGGGCKRRKRQRNILTQANIGIMWQISSLPNNANVRIALARAIR